METLGEDLVLLAIDPVNGSVRHYSRLRFGLRGAELAVLAAGGRIDVTSGRIIVTDPVGMSTGDQGLDTTLAALVGLGRPLKPVSWVGRAHSDITTSYLERLAAAGAVQRQGRGLLAARWPFIDGSRAAAARAKVDAVALGSGQVDAAQTALAGLVSAVGLDAHLYPGWANRPVRRGLRRIAAEQWTTVAVRRAIASAESSSG